MQKIYFKNRILSVCTKEEVPPIADERFLMRPEADYNFSAIPFNMENNTLFNHLTIEVPEGMTEASLMAELLAGVKRIYAAGGLIFNKEGSCLMIYRNGVWDLPKGKKEDDEDIAATALREVKEECGVTAQLGQLITITHHTYWLNQDLVVKSTYWYKMFADKTDATPQTEEGIEKCEWVTAEDLDYRLANTYPSIVDVFNQLRKSTICAPGCSDTISW